jgi:hypothetical protein
VAKKKIRQWTTLTRNPGYATACVINAQRLLASIYMVLALFGFVEFEIMASVFPVRAKVIM